MTATSPAVGRNAPRQGSDTGDTAETRTDDFDHWLATGIAAGYCGPAICDTHDGTPTTTDEDDQFEDGHDPCIHILRLYPDTATRDAVEANHSPSVWRKP